MKFPKRWAMFAVLGALAMRPGRGGADGAGPAPNVGYMGAQLEPAPDGVRVAMVAPNGPGATAGLQAGDVIVRANGGSPGSVDTFTMSVRAAGAGANYPLQVRRGA